MTGQHIGTQAFLNKHYGQRNAHQFAPQQLREAMPGERAGQAGITYVQLQGLGKLPFSNVRRPKPLMELSGSTLPAEVRLRSLTAPPPECYIRGIPVL